MPSTGTPASNTDWGARGAPLPSHCRTAGQDDGLRFLGQRFFRLVVGHDLAIDAGFADAPRDQLVTWLPKSRTSTLIGPRRRGGGAAMIQRGQRLQGVGFAGSIPARVIEAAGIIRLTGFGIEIAQRDVDVGRAGSATMADCARRPPLTVDIPAGPGPQRHQQRRYRTGGAPGAVAIVADPARPTSYVALGDLYAEAGQADYARSFYDAALGLIRPNQP